MGLSADAILAAGLLDDPWLDGRERFAPEPLVLPRAEAGALAGAACAVAAVLDEAVQAVAREPALAPELGLDPSLAAIAAIDLPRWLVLARADVFRCEDAEAPQVCEINCDTPTGLAECTGLAALAALAARPGAFDPSARLGERWIAALADSLPAGRQAVVGIVDPTEMTEDLGHLRLLTRWLTAAGARVVRGSPFNLHACPGDRVGLFGTPIDVMVRHYKTDWWAARRSVWLDEPPPPDHAPLAGPLALAVRAQEAGNLAVVNPWGAAVAQSKRALALPWERPELFSAEALAAARRHLPEGRYAEGLPPVRLIAEQADWVLKGAWGAEGDEVLVGRETPAATWRAAVAQMVPGLWLAQRAFSPRRDAAGRLANHGVYLVGGAPSGIYTRRSTGATGTDAEAVPTLVAA